MPLLDMKGEMPYSVTYETAEKIINRLVDKNPLLNRDDLVSCFISLGSDFNLPSKTILDTLFG